MRVLVKDPSLVDVKTRPRRFKIAIPCSRALITPDSNRTSRTGN